MSEYTAKTVHALTKVFLDQDPPAADGAQGFSMLRGDLLSFQVAYAFDGAHADFARVQVRSPLAEFLHVRAVRSVPSVLPKLPLGDDNFLRTRPGLYPDLLTELEDGIVVFTPGCVQSLWVDVEVPASGPAGRFAVEIAFESLQGEPRCTARAVITLWDAVLPPQTLRRTEWFHADCLADYYGVPVFSPEHWRIVENFVGTAARRGINMILTPHFTPPLDTAVGGERTTTQLVGVTVTHGEYAFDFAPLKRWIDLCLRAGIAYIEMSHLFTQWGALAAPKVMATVDGVERRIFGWDTPATGGAYTRFLRAYLPQLTDRLRAWGVADRTYFHISDEPGGSQLAEYMAAKASVADLLQGFPLIDALSSYALYERGAVDVPVCANDHIEPFLAHGVSPLWSYYCVSQHTKVSNRYMAMPSPRTRIWGVQAFKYGLQGVLHWGYNFYNTMYSVQHVDPYRQTDAGGCFPSGDPFLVYPGADGMPEESIRMMLMAHAMNDVRALECLAALRGRDFVLALIDEGLDAPITFSQYPGDAGYLLGLRDRINELIAQG